MNIGRNPADIPAQGIWSEHIVEIKPIGSNDGQIVWEWHAWDHLIQDFDSTKADYGIVAMHPELLNVNYITQGAMPEDWLHCNSIDYQPEFDQILISSLMFSEVWIIDHSATTEEAAGHAGGRYGKGGDLLYRWGNPAAYGRGSDQDHIFRGQHDAQWVAEGSPGAGQISVFDNNHGDGPGNYSSADFFQPPDSAGFYTLNAGEPFGPSGLTWTYDGGPDQMFYAGRMSAASNGSLMVIR